MTADMVTSRSGPGYTSHFDSCSFKIENSQGNEFLKEEGLSVELITREDRNKNELKINNPDCMEREREYDVVR